MPTGLKSDAGLLHAYRAGDDSAFEELVRRHGPGLRRQCARIVGPDDAEDAVQQALLSASRSLRASDQDVEVGRWLNRVAHNAAIDALRRRPPAALELDDQYDGVPQPPDVAAGRESLRETVAAIQQLPDAQRRALLLSVFEDHSWEEIAEELGTGEGAVRGLLHRARNGMRAAVALAVFPFFLLKAHAARAATNLARNGGSMGATAKAGVVVVIAGAAGGSAAVVISRHHDLRPVPGALRAEVPSGPSGAAVPKPVAHAARRARRRHRAGHHAALATVALHRRSLVSDASGSTGTAPSGTQTTGHAPVIRHGTGGGPHGDPGSGPTTTTTTPTTPTDTTPAQTPPPDTTPTTPPDTTPAPPPDTTPTNPPAPSTVARVDNWTAASSTSGQMHAIFDDGRDVTGYVTGDGTSITCDTVKDGRLVSSQHCDASSLGGGERLVSATYHLLNSRPTYEFDAIELVLPS